MRRLPSGDETVGAGLAVSDGMAMVEVELGVAVKSEPVAREPREGARVGGGEAAAPSAILPTPATARVERSRKKRNAQTRKPGRGRASPADFAESLSATQDDRLRPA
jgi:hypothetical protein